jgi:predicted RNase H-like nuclease (RuvC/YqgF family)
MNDYYYNPRIAKLEEENLALDDEIKELKAELRMHKNALVRTDKLWMRKVEDLRAKLLERDERIETLLAHINIPSKAEVPK